MISQFNYSKKKLRQIKRRKRTIKFINKRDGRFTGW